MLRDEGSGGARLAFDYGNKEFIVLEMQIWTLSLHEPRGILSRFDSQEAQFVLGTEEAPDVLSVAGEENRRGQTLSEENRRGQTLSAPLSAPAFRCRVFLRRRRMR